MGNTYHVILLLFNVIYVFLLGFSLSRRDRIKSIYFTILCGACGLYLLGHTLEAFSTSLDGAYVALKVENLGIPMAGPFLALTVLSICMQRPPKAWIAYLATAYSLLLYLAVLFNEHHHLYYRRVDFASAHGSIGYLVLEYGPLFKIQQGVLLLCMLFTCFVLFRYWRRWVPKARRQMSFLIVGFVLAYAANILHTARLVPDYIDPVPLCLTLVLLFSAFRIVHHNLFDMESIAAESAVQTMSDAFVVLDSGWCYQFSNGTAKELFPGLASLLGAEPIRQVAGWPQVLEDCTGPGEVSFSLTLEAGRRDYRAQISPVRKDSRQIGWSIAIRDITELTRLLQEMESMATTDYLTGISNRRYFMQQAGRALQFMRREYHPASIILFDLDNFKAVNDTHGHSVGDQILILIAATVRQELRQYDVFARYGGEEFILFSVGAGLEEATKMAQRLCDTIGSLRITAGQAQVGVTASFGVVAIGPNNTLEEAIEAADKAMYLAKGQGRNRIVALQIQSRRTVGRE